jgi:hypothetical protein
MLLLLLLLLAAGGWYWWSTRPTAALAGQVVGAETKNQPVAGAEIRILGIPRVVRTDPQGRFELRWLPAGSMQIKVAAAGYETQVVAAETVRGVTTAVAIVLAASHPAVKAEPTAAIKGEVVADACEERKPVAGATIRLVGTNKTVQTDADGRFRMEPLPRGREHLDLLVSAEGYAEQQVGVSTPPEGEAAVDVRLRGAAMLTGTVNERVTGKPVGQATVTLRGTGLKAQTGPDGKFVIDAVPAGQQILRVSADGYFAADQTLVVTPGVNPPAALVLAGDKSLGGEVVWQGSTGSSVAVRKATIRVKGTDVTASADGDGHFAVAGLPPLPLTLVVKAPGFHSREVDCNPRADVDVPVVLTGDASVRGCVVDAAYDPPHPIAGATIRIDQSPLAATSDPDGKFALDGARSGVAKILATAAGYLPQEVSQELPSDTATALGNVVLTGNSQLEGTVVREGSRTPIAGVEVRVPGTNLTVKSDATGRFRFTGLVPGTVELAVGTDGYLPSRLAKNVVSGKNSLQIELKPEVVAPKAEVVTAKPRAIDDSRVAHIEGPRVARADIGSRPGQAEGVAAGAGAGAGPGAGAGAGPGTGTGPSAGPRGEARSSWMALPPEDRFKKVVVYLATGTPSSSGRVYMVSVNGNILDSVGLRYTPTGMAYHKKKDDDHGLVVAIPRDRGRIMTIDQHGSASTALQADRAIPHPVDVGVPGHSDDIFVADDIANVIAHTNVDGREAEVFRRGPAAATSERRTLDQGMSIAVTGDKHVIFSEGAEGGVYRYPLNQTPNKAEPILFRFGGVAADPLDARWAAAQPPDEIYVYDGSRLIKKLSLPPGMVHYRQGLLAFTNDDGWLCFACQEKAKPDEGIWLYLCYDIQKALFEPLFRWAERKWTPTGSLVEALTAKEINDLVVAPWMPWPNAIVAGGARPRPAARKATKEEVKPRP